MSKILLIEDEFRLRENLIEILELYDYEVHAAVDGLDGFAKALEVEPDIILCDVMMPNLNGLDLVSKIKQTHLAHIPIILLTAKVDPEDVKEGLSRGANCYIKKPFLTDDLLKNIKELTSKI